MGAACTRDGRRMHREGEVEEDLHSLRAEIERMRRLLAEQKGV